MDIEERTTIFVEGLHAFATWSDITRIIKMIPEKEDVPIPETPWVAGCDQCEQFHKTVVYNGQTYVIWPERGCDIHWKQNAAYRSRE